VLVLVLGIAGYTGYSELRYRQSGDVLETEIATYHRQRWERPVLRGGASDRNAAGTALEALKGFAGLTAEQRDALASHLYFGEQLAAPVAALLEQHKVMIAKLRAATLSSWSMTEIDAAQGDAASTPPYPLVMDAVLLALADGARAEPDGCLLACADVLRLGQDLVPGAPLEAASVSARIDSVAVPVITRCAARATPDALFRTARELHMMAAHPPPIGASVELADLLAKAKVHAQGELFPKNGGDGPLARLLGRPALLDAFAFFDKPARWRELSSEHYPQTLETWLKEQEWRAHAQLPLVPSVTAEVDGWLLDDMRGQALLRVLTVGLGTLADRATRQRMPREPTALSEPTLCDPFNGRQLKWSLAQDGSELAVWSIGEDRRDDKGADRWTAQAPVDVVVHFRLPPFAAAETNKRLAKR
jgi:hypothetical protein